MDFWLRPPLRFVINQAGPNLTQQPKILRLEYACTQAELREAQSLSLRKQLGGGSRWRTLFVLCLILVGVMAAAYMEFWRTSSASERPYYVALFVICFAFLFWKNRRSRRSLINVVEITENNLTVCAGESKVTMPWSAFSDHFESSSIFVLLDRPKSFLLVFPKRAFSDQPSQEWFRALAKSRPAPEEASTSVTPADAATRAVHGIMLEFRLGLRDYIDRSLNSFLTWSMIIALEGLFIGTFVYVMSKPNPDAVNSPTKVFFFLLPFLVLIIPMIILLTSFHNWFDHKKHLIPQRMTISAGSVYLASQDGTSTLPWSTYPRYKETRRSFILWNPQTKTWIMLPKRAFASKDQIEQCRMLLASNSRQSIWYFG